MTTLGVQLAWLMARVTVVAMLALVLTCWTARRSARATVVVLTGAVLILIALGCGAFVPMPVSWQWNPFDVNSNAASPSQAMTSDAASLGWDRQPDDFPGISINHAWTWLTGWNSRAPWLLGSHGNGKMLVGFYALGVGLAGLHVIVGWLVVEVLKRRSPRINDPDVVELLQSLRKTFGYSGSADLRESGEPGLAATVGWHRPVIFLPPEWRGWSYGKRQAVLAHELAHICHRDYGIGLLARFCQAAYFCHPLMWWLAARLRWHQEVAADDRAAKVAGGRESYWKALAQLALDMPARTPAGVLGWSAITGGSLVRRILMLRGTEERRPLGWAARGALVSLVVMTAVLVSTWGSRAMPAGTKDAAPPAEPFEIGYIGAEAHGFVAIRPSICFHQPGMEANSRMVDQALALMRTFGIAWPAVLRPENIDQVVADFKISSKGTGKPGSRSLEMGSSSIVIRLNQKFDWPGAIKDLAQQFKKQGKIAEIKDWLEDLQEVDLQGIKLHRIGLVPPVGPMPLYLYTPDPRTAVFSFGMPVRPGSPQTESAEHMVSLIQNATKARQRDWGAGVKTLGQSPFLVVAENTAGHYAKVLAADVPAEDLDVLNAVRFATLAIELGEGRPVHLLAEVQSPDAAPRVEKAMGRYAQSLLKMAKEHLAKPDEDLGATGSKLIAELVESRKFERQGSNLEWQGRSSVRLPDLIHMDMNFSSTPEQAKQKKD